MAAAEACFGRTVETFKTAARGYSGVEALHQMGHAYGQLVNDRVMLQLQMHVYTASVEDPDIRRVAQRGMREVWRTAAEASGHDAEDLREWLSIGMLCNVVAALGLAELEEPWARELMQTFTDEKETGGPRAARPRLH